VAMAAWPLTPNGKLDRKRLPAPDVESATIGGYAAPVGPVEETLAAVWAEVLGVERVGRHDDFFALGGHSLLAVTLIERLRRHGLATDVRTLFQTPTLADLAAGITDGGREIVVPPNRIPVGC